MRIREENCNMVLLAAVTLSSLAIAGTAALLEPASAANEKPPTYLARTAATSTETQPLPRTDMQPDMQNVRVVGAPFVPNVNPRER